MTLRPSAPKKPRLTDRVLRGIDALGTDYCVAVALDGSSEPEVQPPQETVDDARAALDWARAMIRYRKFQQMMRDERREQTR